MTNIITCKDVKEKLSMHHGGGRIKDDNMQRELIIHKTSKRDAVLVLSGSPPKGYCITANDIVSFYDVWGERFEILQNTRLNFGDVK